MIRSEKKPQECTLPSLFLKRLHYDGVVPKWYSCRLIIWNPIIQAFQHFIQMWRIYQKPHKTNAFWLFWGNCWILHTDFDLSSSQFSMYQGQIILNAAHVWHRGQQPTSTSCNETVNHAGSHANPETTNCAGWETFAHRHLTDIRCHVIPNTCRVLRISPSFLHHEFLVILQHQQGPVRESSYWIQSGSQRHGTGASNDSDSLADGQSLAVELHSLGMTVPSWLTLNTYVSTDWSAVFCSVFTDGAINT